MAVAEQTTTFKPKSLVWIHYNQRTARPCVTGGNTYRKPGRVVSIVGAKVTVTRWSFAAASWAEPIVVGLACLEARS